MYREYMVSPIYLLDNRELDHCFYLVLMLCHVALNAILADPLDSRFQVVLAYGPAAQIVIAQAASRTISFAEISSVFITPVALSELSLA